MILDFETKAKELELKYKADIDEKAIKREALEMKGVSDTNKQLLDATKLFEQEQPEAEVQINVGSPQRD